MLRQIARRLAAAVILISGVLNVYIYTFPLFEGCKYSPQATVKILAFGDPQITGSLRAQTIRKQIDIAGNDLYLRHTVNTVKRWLRPSLEIVLGDLTSSQWVPTSEFDERADRFWRIFDTSALVIPGNHDIGYHGEFSSERSERYVRRYGPLNYVNEHEGWRIVAINAMALDGPPYDEQHHLVHNFINGLPPYGGSTVLLTHIPLYKPENVCRDGPHFDWYPEHLGGGLRSQNHLTKNSTLLLLRNLMSGGGIILSGHDHEGCLSSYALDQHDDDFKVESGFSLPLKEATVRSIMGEYGGNSGLVSGVRSKTGTWSWEFSICPFRVQHLWWVTQVFTYLTIPAAHILLFS